LTFLELMCCYRVTAPVAARSYHIFVCCQARKVSSSPLDASLVTRSQAQGGLGLRIRHSWYAGNPIRYSVGVHTCPPGVAGVQRTCNFSGSYQVIM